MTYSDIDIKNKFRKSWFIVVFFLVPPWSLFFLLCYWYFFDNQSPLTSVYEHPKFLSKPATSRGEAILNEITYTHSGDHIYTYRELCLNKPLFGTIEGSWVSGALVWSSPQRTFPNVVGCTNRSYAILAPTSNPTRDFLYNASWTYQLNPIITVIVKSTGIPLTVLSSTIPHPSEPHIHTPYEQPILK